MTTRLRIFLSSPGDVRAAREIAALTIERLAQDYARFFRIEPYLWEYEAIVASGHFQDSVEPPSAFDIVILILWSRLGTPLPERTALREYRGLDGRVPVTGTEWEYEEALVAARETGAPDLLVYRSRERATIDSWDAHGRQRDIEQLAALDRFWSRHFANQGVFLGSYAEFETHAQLAAILENHLRKLIQKRVDARASAHTDRGAGVWAQAPFRGLEAYEFEHAPIFFGQDDSVTKAMLQLSEGAAAGTPFLLVLGASGSGKSSLVKAGIVPKLFVPRRITGAAFLRRVVFRPSDAQEGEDLFDALARRLTARGGMHEGLPELLGPEVHVAELAAHLRGAAAEPALPFRIALGNLASTARLHGRMLEFETARLVLVVDQLEELFTGDRIGADERRRFVDLLAGLSRSGLVWIVATMRNDFWHHAADTPELMRLAEGRGRLDLLPPSPAQLGQMIRRPAEAAGLAFEIHPVTSIPLNETIAEDVAREPGALPLLSYVLDQLFRVDAVEQGGNTLTYATYERLGRLEGAIATKAESILDQCAPAERQALGSVLFSLVQMGRSEGDIARAVARRVPLSAFPPGSAARRLVEALLDPDARLLVSDSEENGVPTVRVAHEALITRWSRARDYVHTNAEALKIRRRIEERYALWLAQRETQRPPSRVAAWRAGHEKGLLSDIDLTDAQRLLRDHASELDPALSAYVERSLTEDRRARRRSVRILAGVAAALAVLALAASGAGLVALQKAREAEARQQQTFQAQLRLLTQAAATRLANDDVSGTQAIILEVLAPHGIKRPYTAAALNVFQEARAADRQLAVLPVRGNTVYGVAWSPDMRRIATASDDNTARIWEAPSGAPLGVLKGHRDAVVGVAYAQDGKRIFTASYDKTARVWDAASGSALLVLAGHGDAVNSALPSPDGRSIATSSDDKTARVWDAENGTQRAVLSGHGRAVNAASWSHDGQRIVTASDDGTARIWEAAKGTQLALLKGHRDGVEWASFSPDDKRIVTASIDHTVRIWDAATGAQLAVLSGHGATVPVAMWSPDGKRIASASFDMTARIWDAANAVEIARFRGHTGPIEALAWSSDGRRIVTAANDRTARIWNTFPSGEIAVLAGHADAVSFAVVSPDGRRVATSSNDSTVRIWDMASGAPLEVLSGHASLVSCVAWSPDGRQLVSGSYDKTARIWNAVTGVTLAVLAGHGDNIESVSYSPDGRRIVTASEDRTARIWDAVSGAQLGVLSGHGDGVMSAKWSPNGKRIVTASDDRTARIWDADSKVQLVILSGHEKGVTFASWSPDGRRIVTASRDRTARIWDAATGQTLEILIGHENELGTAVYSPDARYILTASGDKTARIWDAVTGAQLAVLSGHAATIYAAMFSPDGRRVVTASLDKTARIWDARIPADLDAQIVWQEAAEFDQLSGGERAELGLPPDPDVRMWRNTSACDVLAAAPDDPDRRAAGVMEDRIAVDVALRACAQTDTPRFAYQRGRALFAKADYKRAKSEIEQALSQGYPAAAVDLADLLLDPRARMSNPGRAVSLYRQAWNDGVPIAAFELGRLYERHRQPANAWLWYGKGAGAGEPNALARFGEKDDSAAAAATAGARRDARMLDAFGYYAAAAERAQDENWPDDAWRSWRYRRAGLARLLARDGMMQQVADAYTNIRARWRPPPPTPLRRFKQWLAGK